jgi:alpha-beta hydrolase superfamily lysophospholipase
MAAILLVHGAWHGTWCWRDFADRLTAAGHEVRAAALRGHDRPAGRLWYRIRDYVEDVRAEADRFDTAPVVVGHSMGGLVVQKYLEHQKAPAAVLMCSVPPAGAIGTTLRFARRHPLVFARTNASLRLGPVVGTPALAREMLFTPATPAEVVDACYPQLQDESYPAYLGMMFGRSHPARITTPMLVLGGELDQVFSVAEVRATARAYHTEAEIFPGMGHDLMLDQGWPQVADRVDAWITQTLPAASGVA